MASDQTNDDWTIPASLTDNLDKYYFLRYKALIKLYREEDEKAFDIAAELVLMRSGFATNIRCPLLMILSRDNDDSMFLQHAYEAVRILDEDCRTLVKDSEFPHKMYEQALNLRKEAHNETDRRAAAAKLALEQEEAEAEAEAEQDDGTIEDSADVMVEVEHDEQEQAGLDEVEGT